MAENQAHPTPPATPPASAITMTAPFDIVSHYEKLLSDNPNLTPSIAAIESLIALLSTSKLHTVSETLALIATASSALLAGQANPLPAAAGTDLFQRYLVTAFNQTPLSAQSGSDFTTLRNSLITNSRIFVQRAKGARRKIAANALSSLFGGGARDWPADGRTTVITYGSSRVVDAIIRHAGESGRWVNVIYVLPPTSSSSSSSTYRARAQERITGLREAGVSVAELDLSALSLALSSLATHPDTKDSLVICLLGTNAVLENGSVVSEVGCGLVAETARAHSIPLYIATESYKFVRQFPLGCGEQDLARMGTRQPVLHFTTAQATERPRPRPPVVQDAVDITPSSLIAGLVTENGVMTANAVAEELIKLWF